MDGVVHFEIPADDAERAKAFYSTVFDWEMQDFPDMQYTIMMTTPIDDQSQRPTTPGAINGGLMSRSKETPTPVITIGVDSVEEALKKVEAEGGTVITPSTPIPGMGAFGYFKDSEGNVMGLFQYT
jgi:predicted enzyme related to lactoylglutathione lyase